jgi:hypothetical protein
MIGLRVMFKGDTAEKEAEGLPPPATPPHAGGGEVLPSSFP